VSASRSTASAVPAWRVAVVCAVAALAAGMGVAVGTFLLTHRTAAVGPGASYVPATAPFYVEFRLDPSVAQDAALRDLLGRFPPIEGVDLERPLAEQLTEKLDEVLAEEGAEVSWSQDVAPWFDGRVGVALLEVPTEAMTGEMPGGEVPEPSMVVLLGVTDPGAATSSIERLIAEVDEPVTLTEQSYDGVTIRVAEDEGAYAVTDDQLIVAPSADDVIAALDARADGASSLAEADESARLTEALPADWLAFAVYDFGDVMRAALDAAETESPQMADALGGLLENQPLRGAVAVTAAGDRVAIEAVSVPPTGAFARVNGERGLAAEVPSDAIYFADAANIGPALTAFIEPMKEAVAATPEGEEQLATLEAALGADLEELVSWIGDGAMAIGFDGAEPYGGLILVPTDADAAERRLAQLASFASLAAMDPGSGVSVEDSEVGAVGVTTIRWQDAAAEPDPTLPVPTGIAVQFAVTDERVVIGLGETFVGRVLELDPADSLASLERFTTTIDDLGGSSNTAVAWLDVTALREALETAFGPMLAVMDPDGAYEAEVRPWLVPVDRFVSVARLEGDLLVQRTALLVE